MSCDICKAVGKPTTKLRDLYVCAEIADICPDCETIVNKQLSSIQSVTIKIQAGCLKRFMLNLRGKP